MNIPSPIKMPEPLPPWINMAWREMALNVTTGDARILEYFKYTSYAAVARATDNWCSAGLCYIMAQLGLKHPNSPTARHWLNFGEEIEAPKEGAVTVLWRNSPDSWMGHVSFYVSETKTDLLLFGPNQSKEWRVSRYPKHRLLGYRWPT